MIPVGWNENTVFSFQKRVALYCIQMVEFSVLIAFNSYQEYLQEITLLNTVYIFWKVSDKDGVFYSSI